MAEEWQGIRSAPSGSSNYVEGGVMDIQKEKEAFLNVFQFFKSFKGIDFSEETEQFFLRKNKPNDAECLDVSNLNQMWRAWWARANAQVPEGFVLVPRKPTEEMLGAAWEAPPAGGPSGNRRTFYERQAVVYKAMVEEAEKEMIEAQEQGHV